MAHQEAIADKGQIDRLSKMQADISDKLRALQEELDALDALIPLHEVPVDPRIKGGVKASRFLAWASVTAVHTLVCMECASDRLCTNPYGYRVKSNYYLLDALPAARYHRNNSFA